MNTSNEFVYKLPGTILDIIEEDTYQKVMPFVNIENSDEDEETLKIKNTNLILKELGHYIYRKVVKHLKNHSNQAYYDLMSYVAATTNEGNFDPSKADEDLLLKVFRSILNHYEFKNTITAKKIGKILDKEGFKIDNIIAIYNNNDFQKYIENNVKFDFKIFSFISFLELKPTFDSNSFNNEYPELFEINAQYLEIFTGALRIIKSNGLNTEFENSKSWENFKNIIILIADWERIIEKLGMRTTPKKLTQINNFKVY